MYFANLNIVLLLLTCFYITHGKSFNVFNFSRNKIHKVLDPPTISTKWMVQPLDHFNATDKRTWRMRYLQRLDKWKINGPIFIFIEGEQLATDDYLQNGTMFDLAEETNGAMFVAEHRYYGESKPFQNFTTENLQYLTTTQALADLANLIVNIKSNVSFRSSKVVVVGGSYAGTLAVWIKLFYPDLVNAAIASSAPILDKADFPEYYEHVGYVFKKYGTTNCYDKISEIFQRYDKMFKTDAGIQQLKEEEEICVEIDMTMWENKETFFDDKVSKFADISQNGNTDDIRDFCVLLSNSSRIISSKYEDDSNWNETRQCYDYNFYSTDIESDMIAYNYQLCNESGQFQTTSNNQPFTENISLKYYYKACTTWFGPDFNGKRVEDGVERSNKMFGGLSPNVTNVVFVNGELDPWHKLGVLKNISDDAPAILIPRASHCKDLDSDSETDSKELKEARLYIKNLIKKWIGAGEFGYPKSLF